MGLLNRKDMERHVEQSNQQPDVENARIVEFLGKPHVHIDYKNQDIGVISETGEAHRIPVGKGKPKP